MTANQFIFYLLWWVYFNTPEIARAHWCLNVNWLTSRWQVGELEIGGITMLVRCIRGQVYYFIFSLLLSLRPNSMGVFDYSNNFAGEFIDVYLTVYYRKNISIIPHVEYLSTTSTCVRIFMQNQPIKGEMKNQNEYPRSKYFEPLTLCGLWKTSWSIYTLPISRSIVSFFSSLK